MSNDRSGQSARNPWKAYQIPEGALASPMKENQSATEARSSTVISLANSISLTRSEVAIANSGGPAPLRIWSVRLSRADRMASLGNSQRGTQTGQRDS